MAAKKLPRRTMSMAKSAAATAKEAADLDVIEDTLGSDQDNASRFTASQLVLGWLMALTTLLLVMIMIKVVLGTPNLDFPMLPDGYRDAVGLHEGTGDASVHQHEEATATGKTAPVSKPRSPFPTAKQQTPIIVSIECPSGTVAIATGGTVADTVCISGTLLDGSDATIGGTVVPKLDCQEDEVIGFIGVPDTLVCIHIEQAGERGGSVPPAPAPSPTAPSSLPLGAPTTGGNPE